VNLAGIEKRLASLEKQLERALHEREEYRKLYELTHIELERTRRHLFGQKAERVDPAQTQLALDAVVQSIRDTASNDEPSSSPPNPPNQSDESNGGQGNGAPPPANPPPVNPPKTKERKVTPHGRQKLPEHLPVEEIVIMPPEAQGELAASVVRIGEDVSETLEWRTASMVRLRIVRPKFAVKGEPERGIISMPAPEAPIRRSMGGPGLIAHVLTSKYADHLPLHRQEKIYARSGVSLARSTMCNWVDESTGLLKYIVEAMEKDARNAHCIAIDATGVLVQAKEKCRRGYFWVMVADYDHVLFRFTPRHVQDGPKEFLRGYKGYVLADASNVYERLYEAEDVTEVGCWAHCRRYFYEALASDKERALAGIGFIGQLYDIDNDIKKKDLAPTARTEERRKRSAPILKAFRIWLEIEKLTALPKSPIGKAIAYALNHWVPLNRFLEDGRLRLDNNRSELELRRQAVGRKNWLFVGNDDGAEWNAIAVSLIASCALHGIEPWAYLRDVLILLPDWPKGRILELAPKFWKQTLEQSDAQKRLDDSIWSRVHRKLQI
jgi:transposase